MGKTTKKGKGATEKEKLKNPIKKMKCFCLSKVQKQNCTRSCANN